MLESNTMEKNLISFVLICSAMAASVALAQTATPETAPASMPSHAHMATVDSQLYKALGEKAGIASLTDDFVVRLKADRRISEMFKNTNSQYLSNQLADQLCVLSGGPCQYKGADMKSSHANVDIGRTEFNALVEDLQFAMDAKGIAFSAQNELLAKLAPMHRDIINK
jgi:hemoglobin